MPAECSLLLKLDGTTWKQVVPEEPGEFECNPDAAFKLSGRVVDQAELDSNRVSTKFQP
jgi:hypothetical protein